MKLNPILKWAGGKRWLAPKIKEIFEQTKQTNSKRLVEPFCGGLSVCLEVNPSTALINDLNPHLINFYKQVKNGLLITKKLKNDEEFYYQQRERFNALIKEENTNTPEAATIFYYLNRTGFNGLCRFNKKGFYNVPFGKYKMINYAKDFMNYKDTFRKWDFVSKDFSKLEVLDNDFIYADPPYDVEFTQYTSTSFTWEDQIRLIEWLDKHSGPIVISNQATDRILDLYKSYNFNIELLNGPRRISCKGDRTPALEVLATKNIKDG